jgi:hypothetical protein
MPAESSSGPFVLADVPDFQHRKNFSDEAYRPPLRHLSMWQNSSLAYIKDVKWNATS